MASKQKIWIGAILTIIVINIVVYIFLIDKESEMSNIPISIAKPPLEEPNQIYRMQFYSRGSECGLYVNEALIYETYGRGFGHLTSDYNDNINAYLINGKNEFSLKILSEGEYFTPGDDYECFVKINAGKGKSTTETVAYLNIDYAGQDHFTMGDSLEYPYKYPSNFQPHLTIQQPEDSEKIAVISGVLEIANLAISESDTQ